jgi:hypothetical protein
MAVDNLELPPAPAPRPAVRFTRGVNSTDTVTVACKLPHGLILRVFETETYEEPQRDGGTKTVKRSIERNPENRFVVKGVWVASAGQAFNQNNGAVADLLPGGFALTDGCPKDLWDLWLEQNKHSALVKNGIIFASPNRSRASDATKERRDVKSGMEPIDRTNPAEKMGGIDRRLKLGILEHDEGTSSS